MKIVCEWNNCEEGVNQISKEHNLILNLIAWDEMGVCFKKGIKEGIIYHTMIEEPEPFFFIANWKIVV